MVAERARGDATVRHGSDPNRGRLVEDGIRLVPDCLVTGERHGMRIVRVGVRGVDRGERGHEAIDAPQPYIGLVVHSVRR